MAESGTFLKFLLFLDNLSISEQKIDRALKALGKSVGLYKTTKRRDELYTSYLFLYRESSVKISTQTDSY